MKRRGKVWLRVFPDKSYTKKPLETRMGKGKGPLESWVAVIRPANVLIEGRRRDRGRGARIVATGRHQAADQDEIHLPVTRLIRKIYEKCRIRNLRCNGGSWRRWAATCGRRCSPAAAAASSQLEKPARLRHLRKDIARVETRISQLRKRRAIDLYG